MDKLIAGEKITLNKASVYPTPRSPRPVDTKTGEFYLWGVEVVNNKVRITSKAEYAGKTGCVTGWVKTEDLNKEIEQEETNINKGGFVAGQSIELNDVDLYSSSSIETPVTSRTGTYYIWSKEIVNGRVRITNDPLKAGRVGFVTAWIKVTDI